MPKFALLNEKLPGVSTVKTYGRNYFRCVGN